MSVKASFKTFLSLFVIIVLFVSIFSPVVEASIVGGPYQYFRTMGSPNNNSASDSHGNSAKNGLIVNGSGSNGIVNGSGSSSVSLVSDYNTSSVLRGLVISRFSRQAQP